MKKLLSQLFVFVVALASVALTPDDSTKPHYIISVTHAGESLGEIEIELWPDIAPRHVAHFEMNVAAKNFDGAAFHRIVPEFMIQGGDPTSRTQPKEKWGVGKGDTVKLPAEFSNRNFLKGTIAAARGKDINSARSQFFICTVDLSDDFKDYTIFGQVVVGLDVVEKIEGVDCEGEHPIEKVEMTVRKK